MQHEFYLSLSSYSPHVNLTERFDCMSSSSSVLQVHLALCTRLLQLVDRISSVIPEIEAARPRCSSGIKALSLLHETVEKAKILVQNCRESSKLYLVSDHGWFREGAM